MRTKKNGLLKSPIKDTISIDKSLLKKRPTLSKILSSLYTRDKVKKILIKEVLKSSLYSLQGWYLFVG